MSRDNNLSMFPFLIPYSVGLLFNFNIMSTDILFVDDDTQFNDNVDGIAIHRECLSQDYDDIGWEPEVDDTPEVDPNNDIYGYYNNN